MKPKSKKRRKLQIRHTWGDLDPTTKVIQDKRKESLEDILEKELQNELEDYQIQAE